ncbi:hypothetical protein ACTMU2_36765 [Cupriavidus basilensis]
MARLRTGATIYYVELFPREVAERAGPHAGAGIDADAEGDVDVVARHQALMEAGRAVQRGLVTPDRTTLVSSTHARLLDRREIRDGRRPRRQQRADRARQPRRQSASACALTWRKEAEANGSVISAVLFGALAGTGVLRRSAARSSKPPSSAAASASSRSLRAFGATRVRQDGVGAMRRPSVEVRTASSSRRTPRWQGSLCCVRAEQGSPPRSSRS